MKFHNLSKKFYEDYPSSDYPELMSKENRPYTLAVVDVNSLKFAIPLRSSIKHSSNILWTNKKAGCGLDFTKAILILKDEYIDENSKPYIRPDEWKHLLGKERRVKEKMEKAISDYNKAKSNLEEEHNKIYCEFSSLKYFEEYIMTK